MYVFIFTIRPLLHTCGCLSLYQDDVPQRDIAEIRNAVTEFLHHSRSVTGHVPLTTEGVVLVIVCRKCSLLSAIVCNWYWVVVLQDSIRKIKFMLVKFLEQS